MSDDAEHYCLFSETAAQMAYAQARAIAKETGHFPPDHWVACVVPVIDKNGEEIDNRIITHAALTESAIKALANEKPFIQRATKHKIRAEQFFMNLDGLTFIHAHDIQRFGLGATHGDLKQCAVLLREFPPLS